MVTEIHLEKSAQSGSNHGFLSGLPFLSNFFRLGQRGTGSEEPENEQDWNHWLFLRVNGYEVHLAGQGVPVEPQDVAVWMPLLEDISTLIFHPCPDDGLNSAVNSNVQQVTGDMATWVVRLAPILAADDFRWSPGMNESDAVSVKELQVKSFVVRKIIKDYDVAEALFRRALEMEPDHADILGDFALFMQDIRNDFEQAETLYRRAIQVNPRHGRNLGNFAIFLQEVRQDYDEAERLYRRALEVEPENADCLSNFALFLHEVRGEDDQAEMLYRQAWQKEANDAVILANFALFLHDTRRDDDLAEQLYRRALQADGHDANCLGNLALFMKNVRQDYDAAEAYFSRALQEDPRHAVHLGNFALFMKNIRRDYDAAEKLYHRAVQADPTDAHCLGSFASFMKNLRRDEVAAEDLYRRSLQVDPGSATRLGNFVQLLFSQGRIKEALPLLDKALAMNAENPVLHLELWFYVLAHDLSRFDQALGRLKGLILVGTRSMGWDLSANCQRARKEAHPELEFLEALAKVISEGAMVETLDEYRIWADAAVLEG